MLILGEARLACSRVRRDGAAPGAEHTLPMWRYDDGADFVRAMTEPMEGALWSTYGTNPLAGSANARLAPRPFRAYLATGMANSAPLAMLSGQRCMMLL